MGTLFEVCFLKHNRSLQLSDIGLGAYSRGHPLLHVVIGREGEASAEQDRLFGLAGASPPRFECVS